MAQRTPSPVGRWVVIAMVAAGIALAAMALLFRIDQPPTPLTPTTTPSSAEQPQGEEP